MTFETGGKSLNHTSKYQNGADLATELARPASPEDLRSSTSSTRTPHTAPVINDACGLSRAAAKKPSNVVPAAGWSLNVDSSKPVSQSIT